MHGSHQPPPTGTLGLLPRKLCLLQPSRWVLWALKFENHYKRGQGLPEIWLLDQWNSSSACTPGWHKTLLESLIRNHLERREGWGQPSFSDSLLLLVLSSVRNSTFPLPTALTLPQTLPPSQAKVIALSYILSQCFAPLPALVFHDCNISLHMSPEWGRGCVLFLIYNPLPLRYWRGWPFLSPGDLPNPGIEPRSPALQADSLPAETQEKPKSNSAINKSKAHTAKQGGEKTQGSL